MTQATLETMWEKNNNQWSACFSCIVLAYSTNKQAHHIWSHYVTSSPSRKYPKTQDWRFYLLAIRFIICSPLFCNISLTFQQLWITKSLFPLVSDISLKRERSAGGEKPHLSQDLFTSLPSGKSKLSILSSTSCLMDSFNLQVITFLNKTSFPIHFPHWHFKHVLN